MTQEEKELLLQDLCMKFPYGVKVNIGAKKKSYTATVCEITRNYICVEGGGEICFSHGTYKPYLRPLSSMTEEEKEDYNSKFEGRDFSWEIYYGSADWLNAHHFDYRGLIPMGFALEAPEGMYK